MIGDPRAAQLLATAVRLYRRGRPDDRAKLAEHLRAHAAAILDAGLPRGRLLTRALEASLDDAATPIETRIVGGRAWVAHAAPGCEGAIVEHAPPGSPHEPFVAPFSLAADAGALDEGARRPPRTGRGYIAAIWVILLGAFYAFWSIVAGKPHDAASASREHPSVRYGIVAVTTIAASLYLYFARRHALGPSSPIGRVRVSIADDRLDEASASLASLGDAATPAEESVLAGLRAEVATRRGELSRSLGELDAALRATPTDAFARLRIVRAQRALALASLGRADEAHAQLTAIAVPASTPVAERAALEELAFSTELVAYANAHELDAACALLDRYGDERQRSLRVEALGLLVRALNGDAASRALLRRELLARRGSPQWLRAVAPEAMRQLDRGDLA